MKPYLFLLLILLLSSCTAEEPPASSYPPVVASASREPILLSPVPRPTGTRFPTPTVVVAASPPATITAEPATTPLPSATPPQTLTFAVIGDYGTNTAGTQEVAALVNSWDPDLLLTLGDNNYPDGAAETIAGNITQHYGRFVDEKRFFPVLGNHDLTTDLGQAYFDAFDLPGNERYYDFVRGDVHFFALNSDWREVDGIGAGSRQAAWLQEKLAASTAAWRVVYFHAPPYVSMQDKEVPAMRWPFAEWGADLVLSGHAHLYERLQVEGITYLVNGLGGGGIYAFDPEPIPGSQIRFNDDYGALLVQVTAESLRGQFVTRGGAVGDSFELSAENGLR